MARRWTSGPRPVRPGTDFASCMTTNLCHTVIHTGAYDVCHGGSLSRLITSSRLGTTGRRRSRLSLSLMSCGVDPLSTTSGADVEQTSPSGRARSPAESGQCTRTTSVRQKGGYKMTAPGHDPRTAPMIGEATRYIPWWKEPTRDQRYAYIAAWLGWTSTPSISPFSY